MVIFKMLSKKSQKVLTVSLMIWLLPAGLFASTQQYQDNDTVILKEVSAKFSQHLFTISLKFNKVPLYVVYWIKKDQTLFIDLIGSNILSLEKFQRKIKLLGLESIKVKFYPGYEPSNGKPGKVDGLLISMSRKFHYKIRILKNRIEIVFPELKEIMSGRKKEEKVEIPSSFSFTPEQKIGPKNRKEWQEAIMGWQRWLDIGRENYRPLRIAKEQYELAQLKLREAKRQLFPTAVIRLIDTTGHTIGDVGIFSKEYELEFEQPISYGGELRYKITQAEINMKVSLLEYQRLYEDFALELKRRYYDVILKRMNWDTFNKLLVQANKLKALGEVLYKKGVITELEYKQLQSSYQQVKFQVISAQKELSLSELSFRQTLNLPEDELLAFVNWLPFEKVNVDLNSALNIAKNKRPELKIRELLTYFNNLNEQIAKAKNRFRISLTGKIGKMAEDYSSEPEVFRDSWYVGLKVSKPLGSSTLNTSVTKQNRPVGNFSLEESTDTFTKSVEFSLVDRLGAISDEKAARVELLKAINEELETEETVTAEVEKAYANYISALFQIETSLKRLDFQRKKLQVVEGRMKVEEANISELLQAYLDYTNEKINYNRALIGYYVALSSLSKGCGVESYLSLATEKPVITAWERFSEHPPVRVNYTPFNLPEFKKETREAIRSGIEGRIIGVNNKYGMAILNIGKKEGLSPASKVLVYRKGEEYALLLPLKIEKNTSACYLQGKRGKGFQGLRIGDKVEILK